MAEIRTPVCREDERRSDLVSPGPGGPFVDLNGIDFVEVDAADHRILRVTFLKPLPAGAYGIPGNPGRITITGGTRIIGIEAVSAAVETGDRLRIDVDEGGDYSPYVLTLDAPELDPVKRSAVFSFMASCPVDVDCRPRHVCPPEDFEEPLLDYLAKDYASFRRLLLDLLPGLNPNFVERNPADLGIALVELLAYAGDHISYFQDAVANEAYLDTLRRRVSARRHARLVDYRMHDGRNAWTAVHVAVSANATLPVATPVLTRIAAPLRGDTAPPEIVVPASRITVDALETDPALASVVAFETAHAARLRTVNNEIRLHTWGDDECCLEAGATEAYLYVTRPGAPDAVRPELNDGDLLLVEEVLGPRTGAAADADPAHRQIVRIEGQPEQTTDPLYAAAGAHVALQVRQPGQAALPLLRVRWSRADGLRFPLCLSTRLPGGNILRHVSVARGNLVLADHGLTTEEAHPNGAVERSGRLTLERGPLTMECRESEPRYDPVTGAFVLPERGSLDCGVREVRPAVRLLVTTASETEPWTPVPDLLDTPPFEAHFVAEVDDEGRAVLRFGDGEYGRRLSDVVSLRALYRVGNGRAGNVGRDALTHVALTGPANFVLEVRNPVAAAGGVDPETIEEVRQRAPDAFRAEQFRAVTEADWSAAARRLPEVAGTVAAFRWTGSWYTVFIAVDPRDPADLEDLPGGTTRLRAEFERRVRAFLGRYRIAGYDLELRPPRFVPLELELEVCAAPGYFREDVAQAVRDALSRRVLPDARRGFFHSDNFTFGDPVYLSRIYAAVERVEGVDSVAVRRLRRFGQADAGELERGVLRVGPWEIVRLDNDPSFVEHGVLTVIPRGGKA